MTHTRPHQRVYAEDRLAGLYFATEGRPCLFRADCGFEFNHPLDPTQSYVATDPETDEPVGIYSPTEFTGDAPPPLFHVFLLRPLLRDL